MHVLKPTILLAAAKKARPQLQVLLKNIPKSTKIFYLAYTVFIFDIRKLRRLVSISLFMLVRVDQLHTSGRQSMNLVPSALDMDIMWLMMMECIN